MAEANEDVGHNQNPPGSNWRLRYNPAYPASAPDDQHVTVRSMEHIPHLVHHLQSLYPMIHLTYNNEGVITLLRVTYSGGIVVFRVTTLRLVVEELWGNNSYGVIHLLINFVRGACSNQSMGLSIVPA